MPKSSFGLAADRRRTSTPALAAAMLAAIGLTYILLVVQPGLLRSFNTALSQWPSSQNQPGWLLVLLVIGVAAAGVALALLVLAGFVRSAQSRPYLWLSPVLVGFTSVIVMRAENGLPLTSVPVPLFAACGGLLMMGGGALLQARDWMLRTAGAVLLALPTTTLLTSLSLQGGELNWPALAASWSTQDVPSKLVVITLALASGAIALLAIGTRPQFADPFVIHSASRDEGEIGEGDGARQGGGRMWEVVTAAALITLGLGALFGYLGVYRPLIEREARAVVSVNQHLLALDQQRESFEAERTGLAAERDAERAKASEASAALAKLRAEVSAAVHGTKLSALNSLTVPNEPEPAPRAEAAPEGEVKAKPKAKPTRARALARNRTAQAPAPAKAPAAVNARATKAAVPTAMDKQRLGGAVDDDPIGGLDDL